MSSALLTQFSAMIPRITARRSIETAMAVMMGARGTETGFSEWMQLQLRAAGIRRERTTESHRQRMLQQAGFTTQIPEGAEL